MGNNTLEVVLNIVDNLSPAISAASESINSLQNTVDSASASIDNIDPSTLNELASNAENASNELNSIDTGNIEEVANTAENASTELEQIQTAANNASNSLSTIDSSNLNNIAENAENVTKETEKMGTTIIGTKSILSSLVGIGIGAYLMDSIHKASASTDAWNMLSVVVEKHGGILERAKPRIAGLANQYGFLTSDIRQSSQIFMQAGMTYQDVAKDQGALQAAMALSVATGRDVTDSSVQLQRAYMGNGKALKLLGMDVEDYRDKQTGLIDKERLNQDILEKYGGQLNEYSNSYEAMSKRMEVSIGALQVSIGKLLLPLLPSLIEGITSIVDGFNKFPGPLKEIIFGFTALVGSITALYMILNPIRNSIGSFKDDIINLKQQIQDLPSKIRNLSESVSGWGENIKKTMVHIKNYILGLKELVLAKKAEAAETIKGILLRARETASIVISTLAKGAHAIANTALTASQWALNAAMSANPIGIVIIAIVGLVAVLIYLWNTNEGFRNALINAWNTISSTVMSTLNNIQEGLKITGDGLIWFINFITGWAGNLINTATQAGSGFITNLSNWISQLPGRIWTYLISTISKIVAFASMAYNQARNVGLKIVNGIGSTLANLPGKMYTWGKNALNRFINSITDSIPGLKWALNQISGLFPHSPPKYGPLATIKPENMYKFGAQLSQNFANGLNNNTPSLLQNLGNISPPNISIPTIQPPELTSFDKTHDIWKNTTNRTWEELNNTTSSGLEEMKTNLQNNLTTMVNTNKASYNEIKTTTQNVLNSLKTQTTNNMGHVKQSWHEMRDSLTHAANTIRSRVGSDVSKLSQNIATFYRRIRNPSLFLAGPGPGAAGPGHISIPHIPGNFAGPPTTGGDFDLLERASQISCTDNFCFAGDWNQSNPHIATILSNIHNYAPNFDSMGNLGLKVKDFINTSMPLKGQMAAFSQIAANLIGKTRYSFYYNSQYGSPEQALSSGAFNCYDGALIMLALARAFGLSGRMEHGHWGNVGHVWANIGGKTFDTTAYQHGYGWSSPKVHAGPPPHNLTSQNNPETININDKHEYTFKIQLENIPSHLNEKQLNDSIEKIVTDSELIQKLVKNRTFQDTLKIELMKTKERTQRTFGG